MTVFNLATQYKRHGFTPFPLQPMSKTPPDGCRLSDVDIKRGFTYNSNIGVFMGSPNGLVVIDCDSPSSQQLVSERFRRNGWWSWTTIVRTPKRGGFHFWLKVLDVPAEAQSYYKLPNSVGGGEFRVRRPAYVVAPGSVIKEGEYTFIQGGIEFFDEQPAIPWEELTWLHNRTLSQGQKFEEAVKYNNPMKREYKSEPPVLRLLETLATAEPNDQINRINIVNGFVRPEVYGSRSEAEMSAMMGFILAGWPYTDIQAEFEAILPAHYAKVSNRDMYLQKTYDRALSYLSSNSQKFATK